MLEVLWWMYEKGEVAQQQKHGVIVCIPKSLHPVYPPDYRPLTLLNTDLNLLARIIARRLDPWLPHILHPGKHCGVRGKSILEAAAKLRSSLHKQSQ
jgi:hypothetical protein